MKLSADLQAALRCPATHDPLQINDFQLEAVNHPDQRYPIVDGIPVLIHEQNSLFTIEDFVQRSNTTFDLKKPSRWRTLISSLIHSTDANIKAKDNYRQIIGLLPRDARVLIIGGSIKGHGMDEIYSNPSYEIVGSDVSFGPCTTLICDAHDIPFVDGVFDCVILQAVLEHVLEPQRCVNEVHRVLKSTGIVYAETPFMQQVHMKQYDFTRFTPLGHRRLFRYFTELSSGPGCGPGMALAWSYSHFLRSFTTNRWASKLLIILASMTSFFLKYFDYYLINKPGAYDAASGVFFLGRKNTTSLPDKELLKQFKGAI